MSRSSRPRLGFLGTGWIGLHRMKSVLDHGGAEIAAVCEPNPAQRARVGELVPAASHCASLEELLERGLDGVVIATPSAQHAREACLALSNRVAVFCQKPLARSREETARVVDCARSADRLLGVDFSYRHTRALSMLKDLVSSGELGRIYNARLVFHNAYGPDKAWYRDRALSGGGCAIDLGIHWLDAALWLLDTPKIERVSSQLFAGGERLALPPPVSEDFMSAQLETASGAVIEIACSWNLSAGREAVIQVELHGTKGGAALYNDGGSFYDFHVEHWQGTKTARLLEPPDDWGGRAVVAWVERLARSNKFDPSAKSLVCVAELLDRIYRGR